MAETQDVTPSRNRPKCPVHGCEFEQRHGRFGMFYGCPHYPECDRTASRSKQDKLWRISDQLTRNARKAAHKAFDELWKSGKIPRTACYRALAKLMDMPANKCHIEHFGVEYCGRVVELVKSGAIIHERAKHLALREPIERT